MSVAEAASVAELLADAAGREPESAALVSDTRVLTYRELAGASAALAAEIQRAGDEASPVAILTHRCVEAVVAICACQLARRPYVPLDPGYPLQRNAACLTHSGAQILVGPDTDRTSPIARARSVAYLGWGASIQSGHDTFVEPGPASPAPGDALAYILYTSGSTGAPKGVEVTAANLLASTRARESFYGDLATHRSALIPSMAFDSSVGVIFGSLCSGGSLVVPDSATLEDTGALVDLLTRHQVTQLLCVPSYYSALLAEHDLPDSLRRIVVAGEACLPALVRAHMARLPDVELVNEYGPTEATVWAAAHRCSPVDGEAPRVPIGLPIRDVELILLDEQRAVVAPGLPGELHIKGPTVARGYRGDPDLTARRFITNPRGPGDTDERLYATGDIGRFDALGRLEFLGRADRQVKVHGVRVELDEVESALGGIEGVREAAVVCPAQDGGGMAGFVVPDAGVDLSIDAIRARTSAVLPRAMVPADLRLLKRLPRLPNGKVAYETLRSQAVTPVSTERGEPENDVEEELQRLWASVLHHSDFGVTDDFFLVGGNSIKVVALRTRAREAGLLLTVQDVFEARTIRDLSKRVALGG
ncbi:MAG TPA: non-ribosomal peptide synthetase [Thermoleophilaceae bacterium]|jgi:amino acid adenylation domain-containing protein